MREESLYVVLFYVVVSSLCEGGMIEYFQHTRGVFYTLLARKSEF